MWQGLKRFKGASGVRFGSAPKPQPGTAPRADFLNLWPWAPGGYVSPSEQRGQGYRTQQDPLYGYQAYAQAAAHWVDRGDEVFGGSSYAYAPLDIETHTSARAEKAYAYTGLISEPEPQTPQWPAINALLDQAYGSLNSLWQRIAGEQSASNDW